MNTLTTSEPKHLNQTLQNTNYQFKNTSAYCFTNFFEGIYSSLKLKADKKLLFWNNGYSTGKLLADKISGIRNELILHRIAPAEEVMIMAALGEEQIAATLAVMALGAIPVLPPSNMPPKELLKVIRSRRINTILSSQTPLLVKIISSFSYLNIIETTKAKSCDLDFPVRQVNHHQGALISISYTTSKEVKTNYQSHKFLFSEYGELTSTSESKPHSTLSINLLLYNLCKGSASDLTNIPNVTRKRIH